MNTRARSRPSCGIPRRAGADGRITAVRVAFDPRPPFDRSDAPDADRTGRSRRVDRRVTSAGTGRYHDRMALYDDVGGFDVLLRLCQRWNQLCLADPVAAHPFSRPLHPQHQERLAAYLAQAFGGPALYTAGYGDESRMLRFHAGNGSSRELTDACLRLFDQALGDVGIEGAARDRVSSYFRRMTESFEAYADSRDLVPRDAPFSYER